MFELIYFDLTENEYLININKEMQLLTFINLFIFIFLRLIIMIASSHKRIIDSKNSVKLVANIQININNNLLNYYLTML